MRRRLARREVQRSAAREQLAGRAAASVRAGYGEARLLLKPRCWAQTEGVPREWTVAALDGEMRLAPPNSEQRVVPGQCSRLVRLEPGHVMPVQLKLVDPV